MTTIVMLAMIGVRIEADIVYWLWFAVEVFAWLVRLLATFREEMRKEWLGK